MTGIGFVSAYYDFFLELHNPLWVKGTAAERTMLASFKLNADVTDLAPYINAVARRAVFSETPAFIRFPLDGFACTLCRNGGSAAAFSDRDEALDFMETLLSFLNDIHRRRSSIQPSHKKYKPLSALDILRLLPGTNCGACGFASCLSFAAALSRHRAFPRQCPGFSRPISLKAVYPVFDRQGNLLSTFSIELDSDPIGACPEPVCHPIESQERISRDKVRSAGAAATAGDFLLAAPLSRRERTVLRFIAEGATNREISNSLGISPNTVKSHVVHIFNKLGVNDRTQAAVIATRSNLV